MKIGYGSLSCLNSDYEIRIGSLPHTHQEAEWRAGGMSDHDLMRCNWDCTTPEGYSRLHHAIQRDPAAVGFDSCYPA